MVTGDHGVVTENVQQPVEVARRYGGDLVTDRQTPMGENHVRVWQQRGGYVTPENVQVLMDMINI